ncbi:biotin--[acetyl-CoA-carboxylase] ligase [Microbacterium sp.]|uniref:biotin--[acetyl-CoA-carboxylase] ligase n=1 Tax=Microbacterium sp. TaxID=51671 RepID=UPI0039E6F28C
MSFPPQGYPLAAAATPSLHLVETADSTNALLLRAAAADPDRHPHLAVVLTRDQRAGRGRHGRTWTAPPDTALAVSVLLRVEAVPVSARGWIPLSAGIAMCRAVAAQLPAYDVVLKWPNDVLVAAEAGGGRPGAAGGKICGILAEVDPVDPHTVVVGAGVNTRMPAVELPVATATSFLVLGVVADEDRLLADFLTGLRDRIAALAVAGGAPASLRAELEELCATIGAEVAVSLPDGTTLRGRAVALDEGGRLVVEADGVRTVVGAGDVVHVR